jgi:hypothetical protein
MVGWMFDDWFFLRVFQAEPSAFSRVYTGNGPTATFSPLCIADKILF